MAHIPNSHYWRIGDIRDGSHDAIPLAAIPELQGAIPNGVPTPDDAGRIRWKLNGLLHRTDGPAYETTNGKYWYINGKLHREDGPAAIWADGNKSFYLNDIKYNTQAEYLKARDEMQKRRTLPKDFVPLPTIMASNAFVSLVSGAKSSADIEASDLVIALQKAGWNVDVSSAINADGRKGFVLTLLQPTATNETIEPTVPTTEKKAETNVQVAPKIIRKPRKRKPYDRSPF